MTDYKKYSLGQLENFLYDAMGAAEATPQEIYDVIKGVVEDTYYTYKKQALDAYELLALLNGNGDGHIGITDEHSEHYYDYSRNKPICNKDDTSPECKESWNDFWEEPSMPPWGHSDMEALRYTKEELDAMCAAELISKGYFKEDGLWKKPKDKVVKWILPIEEVDCDECVINLPDDLLEAANLKEGDEVEWIDQGNGSYLMKKVIREKHQKLQ